ncbi:MAG: C25 family cysteine peptidase [Chitinophagales bacterium]
MKNLFAIITLFLFQLSFLQAQTTYTNDWIDFDKTYYEIKVIENGLHRISATSLAAENLPLTPDFYQLYNKGKEVPFYIHNPAGNFDNNDYIEFYGQRNDGELDTQLYWYESHQPSKTLSLFCDTATYYLVVSDANNNLRHNNFENNLNNAPPKDNYFWHTNSVVTANQHYEGKPFRLGGINNHFADFESGEGFISVPIDIGNDQSWNVWTRSIYTQNNALQATVSTKIIGMSNDFDVNPDHHIQIKVNGNTAIDDELEGYLTQDYEFEVPLSQLNEPQTSMNFAALDDISEQNRIAVANMNIRYPRTFDFSNKQDFLFEIDNTQNHYIEVANFDGGSNPFLYDLTNNLRIFPILENNVYKFHFLAQTENGTTRQLYFVNPTPSFPYETVTEVTDLQTINFTDFSLLANQGNYLIVTHPKLMQGNVNQVERYAEHRQSELGGDYNVIVVNIEELYGQFSWGIDKHPLAIQKFINFAIAEWNITPEYLFLLGKSVNYKDAYVASNPTDPYKYNNCLVPSYGIAPSDAMLSSPHIYTYRPQLATGRVPAKTAEDVRIYLDKMIMHDSNQFQASCDAEDRLWMKDALHIAGGNDLDEANLFLSYLEGYRSQWEGDFMAGNIVATYNKLTEEVIETIDVGDILNAGISVLNFFGHSSGEYWALDIDAPTAYENYGKYPFIITGSCNLGDIHSYNLDNNNNLQITMPEEYLFADSLGAIGFLASASLGYPSFLNPYLETLYQNFCVENYGEAIGFCVKETVREINAADPENKGMKVTSQEYTLAGDPAIRLNAFERPEYLIEPASIVFEPQQISADVDSFAIHTIVTNLGRSVVDSFRINIERTFPDGTIENIISANLPSPQYIDTFTMYIQTGDIFSVAGDNQFSVSVDFGNEIEEDCEDNNMVSLNQFIFSDLLVPIAPCNFSIVTSEQMPLTLSASTGEPLTEMRNYIVQLDTNELFINPLFENVLDSEGSLLQWQPNINLENNTVYYWRTARNNGNIDSLRWKNSSFIYLENEEFGFNQSHYYQYTKNDFENLYIDSLTRNFEFQEFSNKINLTTAQNLGAVSFYLNDLELNSGSCLESTCLGGIGLAIMKPELILEPWISERLSGFGCEGIGTYNNIHCTGGDLYVFEFNTSDFVQLSDLQSFINNEIPDGYYVGVYSTSNHRLETMSEPYRSSLISFFDNMGFGELANITNAQPFVGFGQKNRPEYAGELVIGNNLSETISIEHFVNSRSTNGKMKSVAVGPALDWQEISWNFSDLEAENSDEISLKVEALNGNETLEWANIDNVASDGTLDISGINATEFPFLQLTFSLKDSLFFTPAQLDFWRTSFTRFPEAALNTQQQFVFHADTLQEGELLQLDLTVANVETTNMDSVLVAYTIIDKNNNSQTIEEMQAPIAANESIVTTFSHSTTGLLGNNVLIVTVNPNDTQAEKFSFNNIIYLPFYVEKDPLNPIIDVVFDGRHILDGDIVSAEPMITISLKDENPYLALNDTADFKLFLLSPNEYDEPIYEERIYFNSEAVQFFAANENELSSQNNRARIEFSPTFEQSGTYQLKVEAKDRSGNVFANDAYRISFKIEHKPMISNLLNYPNPFTSSTKFVFTLTGSEVPEFLKIQIMTVSGKVVREITQAELGDIHIGTNITEYAWDGTDEFGSPLANGLYLYRFVSRLNGETLEQFDTAADDLFKKGIGKMYLMR